MGLDVPNILVYLIMHRMHHYWWYLNMPTINLIENSGALAEGSDIIDDYYFNVYDLFI